MIFHQLLNVAETFGQAALYILILLSVGSIAVAIERIMFFNKRKVDATQLGLEITKKLRANDRAGAEKLLANHPSIEAQVMFEAIKWLDHGTDSVREVIDGTLRQRKKEYERGLLYLGTLGNNAPFVGLFGTVLGIVSAFKELGSAGASGQMGNVMSGIAEALVATAIGILVAIPAVVAFNYFQKKAGEVEENVATLANFLFAEMKSGQRAPEARKTGEGAFATAGETPVAAVGA
jgi:biopolymer transport protein ExbB/biopolymer transport protein TolQ